MSGRRKPMPSLRCKRGHLMTPGNRRVRMYVSASGESRRLSNGCRRCNAENTAVLNFQLKLSYAKDRA